MRPDPLNPNKEATMSLFLAILAALGITAFLGVVTAAAPDANALVRRTVVSGPRGEAVVTRTPRATIVRSRRGTAVMSRERGVAVVSRARGARGAVIVSRP